MDPSDRWLSLALRAALLALFLWMVKGMIAPVLLGGLVAMLVHPILPRLARRLGRLAQLAPAVLTAGVVVLVGIPLVVVASQAIASVNRFLALDWTRTIERVERFVSWRMQGVASALGLSADSIRAHVADLLQQLGAGVAGLLGGIAAELPALAIQAFLFIIALYSLLRDGTSLTRWLRRTSPFSPEETETIFGAVRGTVRGAVLGMIVTALVQGTLTTIALFVFGVPGAFLLGVLATVLSVVPMVGTTPVTVGAAVYLLIVGRYGAAIGMAAAAVVVGVSDNIVRPWVQSAQSEMHPLIALMSIFGGLELFGFAGLFIGPVLAEITVRTVTAHREGARVVATRL